MKGLRSSLSKKQLEKENFKLKEDTKKYWDVYQTQYRKNQELLATNMAGACEYFLDCAIANSECLVNEKLKTDCNIRKAKKENVYG